MSKLFSNPLFRIFGVLAVVYFGLFHNTYKVDSLGNRLDPKVIKQDLSQVKENSRFIIYTLGKVEELKKSSPQSRNSKTYDSNSLDLVDSNLALKVSDLKSGNGDPVVCNDKVEVSYQIKADDQGWSKSNSIFIELGDPSTDPVIGLNLIGMKKDGVRIINVPRGYFGNEQDLIYEITLLTVTKSNKKYLCEK